jgi:hypothetical protein
VQTIVINQSTNQSISQSMSRRARDGAVAKQPHRGQSVSFNADSLKDFVTGFRKRRLERQSYAAAQDAIKERRMKNEDRKERREAMKAELIDKTKMRKRQREGLS